MSCDAITWLLVIPITWINNEKEQVGQEEIQSVQFEEKKSIRKLEVVSQACADRGREIETSPALDERGGCAQTKTLPS